MFAVLTQMFLLILCGAGWRLLRPAGLDGDQTRQVLTAVVYYLFLPALILKLMSQAELGGESLRISLYGFTIMALGGSLAAIYVLGGRLPPAQAGAVWLAVSFPNVTFLGLPVLLETFGDWAALLVIQLDLFSFTPSVLTLGVSVSRSFGTRGKSHPVNALLRVPPLWAAALAIGMNVAGWHWPPWLSNFFDLLARGVTPLMLLSLGLALDWQGVRQRLWPHVLVVAVLRLLLIPLVATGLVGQLGFTGVKAIALVMEAGMPSMLFGIVLCDRFGLDSRLYAVLVTVTTLLAVITLPLWYQLQGTGIPWPSTR